jgi:hypothetical protein
MEDKKYPKSDESTKKFSRTRNNTWIRTGDLRFE